MGWMTAEAILPDNDPTRKGLTTERRLNYFLVYVIDLEYDIIYNNMLIYDGYRF